MRRTNQIVLGLTLLLLLVAPATRPAAAKAAGAAALEVLDRSGAAASAITDGDRISLRVTLAQPSATIVTVRFALDDGALVASCTILPGTDACASAPFAALGWRWDAVGQPRSERRIAATLNAVSPLASADLAVAARPVVLVHGFISRPAIWAAYTGADGYLAPLGLKGYAVGDGQGRGVMLTGNPAEPLSPTNTIAENAAVLGQYIADIKRKTGAQQVDLVAHSLGGLIARYYIDRLMVERDVAQLLMLGTSNGGSPCADLPAALGFYLPAAQELRPAYLREIFNPQITRRRGVPFYQLAGTSIIDSFKSPCTDVPSDIAVDRTSVAAIDTPVSELPQLHTVLPSSRDVFTSFVAPHLREAPGGFAVEPDPLPRAVGAESPQQVTVASGTVGPGADQTLTVNLDRVAVASFALFDPTQSLAVEVRGARGNPITLDPVANGYTVFADPDALVHVGYGFDQPAPGAWTIRLLATAATPASGAPYAISARVVGGARLAAHLDSVVPRLGQPITLAGALELPNQPLSDVQLTATIRTPSGAVEQRALQPDATGGRVTWTPAQPGLYSVDVAARGIGPAGAVVERRAALAFVVQPAPALGRRNLALLLLGGALLLWRGGMIIVRRRAARRAHQIVH